MRIGEFLLTKFVLSTIHPDYLTIDETKIEAAITSKTTAILATHVFGNPCHVIEIEKIAKKHNLKVIYDAAHCFGVTYKGKSVFDFGDVSTCSFHATKVFHTGEGGAVFTNDKELQHKIFYSHNFGHNGPLDFHGLGINAKISELQAAMGLSVLPFMEEILSGREKTVGFYNANLNLDKIQTLKLREGTNWNFSYYPIVLESENVLLEVMDKLKENAIFPRRYFYPSLNTIKYVAGQKMPISESIASRILCLPLSAEYKEEDLNIITNTINKVVC